ncbi:DUF1501 domain-containing protein [Arenibacter lacus]|uniref:DUF1501 domain-containing protein n=1 Tax=Arenibacter lacus TaxID=2608629 RepID=UPI00123DEAF9|nr:DUF1501 domain-containing protein [Arenibacter lacus]
MSNTPTHHHKNGAQEDSHDLEHEYWSRRSFLQTLGIAGSGTLMLGSNLLTASALSPLTAAIAAAETDNILLLIRLAGGNDGLNTIIPISQYDIYANARPNIYIPESKIVRLTDEFGVPTYMKSLESMWGEGQFKAVHGVGYQNQNLSHFTGSDIFANCDLTSTGFNRLNTGWMGRHFENRYPDYLVNPPDAPAAIQIGNYGNLVFQGEETNYAFVTSNVDQLEQIAATGSQYSLDESLFDPCMYGDQLKFLRGTANTTYEYSGKIHEAYARGKNEVTYQKNGFARQLALLARLIKGNLGTKVYMVSMGGFDTHGNQPLVHEQLMSNLSIAVNNFYQDLAYSQQEKQVLGMTFSEFGRRIYENGSNGTDHGKAAPTLFFGSGLNGSAFVGDHPALDDPDGRGNLEFTMDFRDLYATVMAEWLCVPIPLVEQHLLNHPYAPVNLGFNCSGTEFPDITVDNGQPNPPPTPDPDGTVPDVELANSIIHKPFYPTDQTPHLHVEMPFSAEVDIRLFNIMGQHLGIVYNGMMPQGVTEINIREQLPMHIGSGKYIYQIQVQDQKLSKSIMVA